VAKAFFAHAYRGTHMKFFVRRVAHTNPKTKNISVVLIGTILGIVAWTAYAIVECWFSSVLQLFIGPSPSAYSPTFTHWGFTLILFSIYILIGATTGSIIGLFLLVLKKRGFLSSQLEIVPFLSGPTVFTVVFVFFINLFIRRGISFAVIGFAALSLLLSVTLFLDIKSPVWHKRIGYLAGPFTISVVLLGESWIVFGLQDAGLSKSIRTGLAFLYFAGVILLSSLFKNTLKGGSSPPAKEKILQFHFKKLSLVLVVALISIGASAWLNRIPAPKMKEPAASLARLNLPNVILIVMDTVRADHLSLYGYERETCPSLRALAEEAVTFTRAISPSNTTLPSHASLFTGLYPRQHGAHRKPPDFPEGRPLLDEFETIAEVLLQKGYSTSAVVSNWGYVNERFGLAQGFQYFDCRRAIPFLQPSYSPYLRTQIYGILRDFLAPSAFELHTRRARAITAQACRLVDRAKKADRPFFIFINYMDAHVPYYPPAPYDAEFLGRQKPITTHEYFDLFKKVMEQRGDISKKERENLVSQYDGAIKYIDFHIGQLLEKLKKSKLFDNSLIIVTSDHGEAFGEKNLMFHGTSVYQDQICVPLIIKYPGLTEKGRFDQTVSTIDIMPTIIDLVDSPQINTDAEQNLLQYKRGQRQVIVCESYFTDPNLLPSSPSFNVIQWALFSGFLKIIKSNEGKQELYDLCEDPNEENNIFSLSSNSHQIADKLDLWLDETEPVSDLMFKLGKDDLEKLKSLGYAHIKEKNADVKR
jgi:arylsulfatase A-like enzyme